MPQRAVAGRRRAALWRRAPKNRPDEYLIDGTVRDEWGIVYRPAMDGTYYDVIEFPLRGLKARDLDAYPWPDPKDTCRETDTLKREFDKDLTFWGGIDTQRVLPPARRRMWKKR